jgi:signal peptidase I
MKPTTIPTNDLATPASDKKSHGSTPDVARETLESLAVAFILALMFKAFIAEAFIIPTGSMAPTLMGAHKDVVCEDCNFQYQCGASFEFSDVGAKSGEMVFGTICPLCRKPQVLDLVNNANHRTFSGDRILVSKLAYVFSKPERWQVFVFKYADDARLNYIKRCLGTSKETIRIEHGDVYVSKKRPGRSFEIHPSRCSKPRCLIHGKPPTPTRIFGK